MKPKVLLALAVVALGSAVAIAAIGQKKHSTTAWVATAARSVTPTELASWIVEGRRDFVVVDLRPVDQFQAAHVRGAVSCGSCHANRAEGQVSQKGESFVDLSKKIVVYTQTGSEPISLPSSIVSGGRLLALRGGYEGWAGEILAPVSFEDVADPDVMAAKRKQEALRAFFSGDKPGGGAPAALPVTPIRRDGEHKPAGAREGC